MVDAPRLEAHTARMRPAGVAVLLAAVTAFGSGCSNGNTADKATKSDAAPTAGESPSQKPIKSLVSYFMDALADGSPEAEVEARRLTAPGSLARGYMQQMIDSDTAAGDAGQDADNSTGKLARDGREYNLCYGKTCYRYGSFKVDGKGRVASAAVNGNPLRGRVLLGGGSSTQTSLAEVRLLSAFVSTSGGDLIVNLQLKSKDKLVVLDTNTNYRTPAGVQRTMISSVAANELQPNSAETIQVQFEGPVKLGGTLNLVLDESDGSGGFGGDLDIVTASIKLAP